MSASDLSAVIAQMWVTFQPLAASRVAALETYAAELSAGRELPELRAEASSAAHKLAGALGTYGRQGSDEASRLEVLLRPDSEPVADEVRPLVAVLRAAVEQ